MIIPKLMRLPFTFGLSGALHAAVLSHLVVPQPGGHLSASNESYPSASIQVRLVKQVGSGDTGMRFDEVSHTRIAQKSSLLPTRSRAAAPTRPPRERASISLARETAETNSRIAAKADPAVVISSELDSGLKFAETAAVNSSTTAPETYPVETLESSLKSAVNKHTAGIGWEKGVPGETKKAPPTEPDGSIDSPFSVPRAIYSPLRKYPEEARWEKRTGHGSLGFRLKPDGSVGEEIRVLRSSGHADLDATAVESLRHWRFALPPNASPSFWYRYPFRFGMS